MKRLSLLLLVSVCAASAFGTTYVRVEKDGSKTYSDKPMPGGQPVELANAPTYTAPPAPISSSSSSVPREQQLLDAMDDFRYSTCVVMPANDTSFVNPESVSVSLSLVPGLIPDHTVVVTVDGQAIPGGPNSMGATLTTVHRGSHTVNAIVKDRYGKTLCQASTTFHVLRPSLNSPGRRR